MNNRIKQVRKLAGLTQDEFSDKVKVSRNYIFLIEKGERVPSDRLLEDIAEIFGVNLEWLRDGIGEMYSPRTRGEEIGAIVKAAASHDPEQAQRFMLDLVSGLSDAEIVLLYEIFQRHFHPGK